MEKMWPAILASVLFIPIMGAGAWWSDIMSRALVGAVTGAPPPPTLLANEIVPLAVLWLVASAVILLLAWAEAE